MRFDKRVMIGAIKGSGSAYEVISTISFELEGGLVLVEGAALEYVCEVRYEVSVWLKLYMPGDRGSRSIRLYHHLNTAELFTGSEVQVVEGRLRFSSVGTLSEALAISLLHQDGRLTISPLDGGDVNVRLEYGGNTLTGIVLAEHVRFYFECG